VEGPTYPIGAKGRISVDVSQSVQSYYVSTRVTSDRPVLAERSVYYNRRVRVCLDPGHSVNCPASEIDPATGLDVADNEGAPGELKSNWDLACKTRAILEGMGYEVVLTKQTCHTYASLRTRADIGNTCEIMVRLHFDLQLYAVLYPGVGQYKQHGSSIVYVDPAVARASEPLALALFAFLENVGVTKTMNDCGGTSNNAGPAFVGSVLSRVPVVLIEDNPAWVRDNPTGQDQVAAAIASGIDAYFDQRY
jgi:N-acetylmuramoyl-L-alanine amidase